MDSTTAPAFEAFLAGLGVDERAVTESPLAAKTAQVNLNLYQAERIALDDAATAVGISKRSGNRLARAIVRSWLAHRWHHPAELEQHDFGEGHRWSASLEAIRGQAEWPSGVAEPGPVFATLLSRLDRADLLSVAVAVVAQLSESDRATLRRALGEK